MRTDAIGMACENIDKALKSADVILGKYHLSREVLLFLGLVDLSFHFMDSRSFKCTAL